MQRATCRNCAAGYTSAFNYDDGLVDVDQEGSDFRMWFEGKKATCMYTGTYQQQGRVGTDAGTCTCADGPFGNFTLSGLETHDSAFAGRIDATHSSCGLMWQDLAGFVLD